MAYLDRGHALSATDVEDVLDTITRAGITPGPGGSRIVPLESPQIAAWVRETDRSLRTLAAVGLWPSSQLVAHRDAPITGRRFHLPIQTNPDCWSFHDGVWSQLQVGKAYEMDPTGWHGAVNWGTEIRWHLMIDLSST